jgi:mannose/fructose/N-acetylgalactosamine-specific phosphotransferase system component IIC
MSAPTFGITFGSGMSDTSKRLRSGMEAAGSILVAVGSAILLLDSRGLSVLAAAVVLAVAVALIYLVMTIRLHGYMTQIAKTNPDAVAWSKWRWCATHPLGHRKSRSA